MIIIIVIIAIFNLYIQIYVSIRITRVRIRLTTAHIFYGSLSNHYQFLFLLPPLHLTPLVSFKISSHSTLQLYCQKNKTYHQLIFFIVFFQRFYRTLRIFCAFFLQRVNSNSINNSSSKRPLERCALHFAGSYTV